MREKWSWALCVMALGCSSCTAAVTSAEPEQPPSAPVAPPHGIAAGTVFDVAMNQALDTRTTPSGTSFGVHLVQPLIAADGSLLAPAGAAIGGVVESTGPAEAPRLTLHFLDIETPHGLLPLHVLVRSADYERHVAERGMSGQAASVTLYDSWPHAETYSATEAPHARRGMDIVLLAGAHLRLELAAPLEPRPIHVAPASP